MRAIGSRVKRSTWNIGGIARMIGGCIHIRHPAHMASDWGRMGFGGSGLSYAVTESIAQAMRSSVPVEHVRPPDREQWVEPDLSGIDLGRDARGQFTATDRPEPEGDEQMAPEVVRGELLKLMTQSAKGSLGALAHLCGFRHKRGKRCSCRQTLWSIARGSGHLMEASRRRISRVLNQIERGEIVCVDTGKRWAGYPVYVWEQRERPAAAPASINARREP